MERPAFRSIDAAMRFYCDANTAIYETSSFADLVDGVMSQGNGLGGFDGAATCGIIGANLATIPQLWRRSLIARYSNKEKDCDCLRKCCQGWTLHPVFVNETAWISASIATSELLLPSLKNDPRFRESVVRRFFGHRRWTLQDIADLHGLHTNTVKNGFDKVVLILRKEEKRAYAAIDERLRFTGLVE